MPQLKTTVYKYKRFAPQMLVFYGVGTLIFFLLSSFLSPVLTLIAIVIVVSIPIYAGISTKSVFSLRSVDERMLTINPSELVWGNLVIPTVEVEDLDVYIYAFDTFKHNVRSAKRRYTVEHGNKNTLSFKYRNIPYDLTFFLGTFEHYDVLIQILKEWEAAGIPFKARSAFHDSYIREQVELARGEVEI